MKTHAAILIDGERCFAIFDTFREGERVFFVLDRGDGQPQSPVYFHPDERTLMPVSQEGLDFRYFGEPIDVGKFLHLPQERRGFVRF